VAGWIKLHRKILDNPIFLKPDLYQLFSYCLLRANHNETKIIWNGKEEILEKGCFITGRKVIADALKQKEGTIYDRLKVLRNLEMITVKSNNKFSVVKVLNYSIYQGEDTEIPANNQITQIYEQDVSKVLRRSKTQQQDNDYIQHDSHVLWEDDIESQQPANNQPTTNQQPANTDNTLKNLKNLKNEKKYIYTPDELEILELWNAEEIIKHTESEPLKKEIAKALKKPGKEKVILAITQYSRLLHDSDFYYSNKFTLINFLKQKNALPNFLSDGQMWINYIGRGNKSGRSKSNEVDQGDLKPWETDPYCIELNKT